MWAVIDPVMKVVTTEMQGSLAVEMWTLALRLAIKVMLDTGLELRIWALLWC